MITLSNCHHNSPGPMFTDRAINPWISHGLGQRNLSVSISVWMCTYILVWTWVTGCGSLLGCIWAQTRPFVELLYSYLPNYRIQSRMSELITCIYCLQGLGKRNAVVHLTVAHKLSHLPSSSIFAL